MPANHSTKNCWLLRLVFSGGFSLEFSSVFTDIGDWQEMGSLNIKFVDEIDNDLFIHNDIESFKIKNIFELVYHSEEVFSESGVTLISEEGGEIVVVCGVSPGSVSMKAPSSSIDEIDAELDYTDYKQISWITD